MITVGLTGGIASGKSTVARTLAGLGVPVLDLDQVAREVVRPGSPALAEIAARWPDVVRDGHLDRRALGARVAEAPEARRELEAITHPASGPTPRRGSPRRPWPGPRPRWSKRP